MTPGRALAADLISYTIRAGGLLDQSAQHEWMRVWAAHTTAPGFDAAGAEDSTESLLTIIDTFIRTVRGGDWGPLGEPDEWIDSKTGRPLDLLLPEDAFYVWLARLVQLRSENDRDGFVQEMGVQPFASDQTSLIRLMLTLCDNIFRTHQHARITTASLN